MSLIKRSAKGSPLTWGEMDGNIDHFDLKTKDGWADIVAELYTRSGVNSPNTTQFIGNIYLYEFDPTVMMEAFANFHIPHAYKPGTMIYPHMHFSVQTNNSGVVRWGFEYTFARRHDSTGLTVFPAPTTLYKEFTIPSNSANTHFVAEVADLAGIPGTDIEVDGIVMMRVFRDPTHPNDTFPDSVFGITADLHHEVDRHATPQRAPDFYAA